MVRGSVSTVQNSLRGRGAHLSGRFRRPRRRWSRIAVDSRAQHVPDYSIHSLFLINLFNSSYPDGNFEGNQLLDGSLLNPSITNDLHVSTATSLHQSFP